MQQLRFCLCLVARAVAGELGRVGASWGRSLTMFKPALRKTLFVAFSDWSEEGSAGKCLSGFLVGASTFVVCLKWTLEGLAGSTAVSIPPQAGPAATAVSGVLRLARGGV